MLIMISVDYLSSLRASASLHDRRHSSVRQMISSQYSIRDFDATGL